MRALASPEVHPQSSPGSSEAIKPFLAKFSVSLTSPAFDSQIDPLYDEGVVLLKSAPESPQKFELRRALDLLEEEMDLRLVVPSWAGTSPVLIQKMRLEIREKVSGDDYAGALTVIENRSKKFGETEEISHLLIRMKEALGRAATSYVQETKMKCDQWRALGQMNDAVRLLAQAQQKLSGFAELVEDLRHYAQSMR